MLYWSNGKTFALQAKHRGSIPAISTVLRPDSAAHHGIEEDGNLPDPESGETRFDSAGPDRDVV